MLQRTTNAVSFGVCGSMEQRITYGIEYIFSGSGNPEGKLYPMNLGICARASLRLRACSVITYIPIVVNAVEILTNRNYS
jgi:hypothetical protein